MFVMDTNAMSCSDAKYMRMSSRASPLSVERLNVLRLSAYKTRASSEGFQTSVFPESTGD